MGFCRSVRPSVCPSDGRTYPRTSLYGRHVQVSGPSQQWRPFGVEQEYLLGRRKSESYHQRCLNIFGKYRFAVSHQMVLPLRVPVWGNLYARTRQLVRNKTPSERAAAASGGRAVDAVGAAIHLFWLKAKRVGGGAAAMVIRSPWVPGAARSAGRIDDGAKAA